MGLRSSHFCALFLLIASGGLLLFYREAMIQRINEVINPQAKPRTLIAFASSSPASPSAAWWSTLKTFCPRARRKSRSSLQRLTRAGFRDESAVKVFYGAKVLVPLRSLHSALRQRAGAL